MSDHTIAAIPTVYRGVRYRSRLEARWAAFFYNLGITTEYEPYDLGTWSPDFLIPTTRALVEVKPLTQSDSSVWPVWEKARDACLARQMIYTGEDEDGGIDYPISAILVTRVSPILNEWGMQIGWFGSSGNSEFQPLFAHIGFQPLADRPYFTADITCAHRDGWWTSSGQRGDWNDHDQPRAFPEFVESVWAKSCAEVQWKPQP